MADSEVCALDLNVFQPQQNAALTEAGNKVMAHLGMWILSWGMNTAATLTGV